MNIINLIGTIVGVIFIISIGVFILILVLKEFLSKEKIKKMEFVERIVLRVVMWSVILILILIVSGTAIAIITKHNKN